MYDFYRLEELEERSEVNVIRKRSRFSGKRVRRLRWWLAHQLFILAARVNPVRAIAVAEVEGLPIGKKLEQIERKYRNREGTDEGKMDSQ